MFNIFCTFLRVVKFFHVLDGNHKVNFNRMSMESSEFERKIQKKEKSHRDAVKCTKYVVPFLLLQLIDGWVANRTFSLSFFAIVEYTALLLFLAVMWGISAVRRAQILLANREMKFDWLLKSRYIVKELQPYYNSGIIWKSIETIMVHPEITAQDENTPSFLGWYDDGRLLLEGRGVVGDTCGLSLCLLERPWTCTEKKNVTMLVGASGAKGKKDFSIKEALEHERISYDNELYFYPIFRTADGKLVRHAVSPILITSELLDAVESYERKNIGEDALGFIGKGLFEKSVCCLRRELGADFERLSYRRAGILSLYQDVLENSVGMPKITFLALIELEKFDLPAEKLIDESGIASAIIDKEYSLEMNHDAAEWRFEYSLLMYAYARMDRFIFAEEFLKGRSNATQLDYLKALGTEYGRKLVVDSSLFRNIPTKYSCTSIGDRLRKALYKIRGLVFENVGSVMLLVATFFLEKIVEPLTIASGETKDLGTLLKLLRQNHFDDTLVFVGCILAAYLVLFLIVRLKRFDRFVSPGNDILRPLFNTENKTLKIGQNCNLFWNDNLVEGWPADKFCVSVTRENYSELPIMANYNSSKLDNEPDDGEKFRMVGISQNSEGATILVDQCRYTQTMRVQNMIHVMEGSVKKENGAKDRALLEDQLKRGVDLLSPGEVSAAKDLYKKYLNGLMNLKSRNSFLDLTQIPANSLCMHSVVLTKDNYLLTTRRMKGVSYYAERFACSAEEQLSVLDFNKDGARVQNWAERFLEEELGVTKRNVAGSSVGDFTVLSVFLEENCLNIALVVKIKLNLTARQLRSILNNWPRKDYEFQYCFLKWGQLVEHYKDNCDSYHPTAINRMVLVALSEMEFDVAKRLLSVAK